MMKQFILLLLWIIPAMSYAQNNSTSTLLPEMSTVEPEHITTEEMKVPQYSPETTTSKSKQSPREDKVSKFLDSYYSQPPSITAQAQPQTFDWKKSNADRFVNSPCYHQLGFDPFADPVEQERKYCNCEDAKQGEKMKNIGIIAAVIIAIIALIALGIKGSHYSIKLTKN